MDALTLDQFEVFIAVVDQGSFAAAARRLGRAQSAVTYAVQKLEDQSGLILFDRSAYRPTLTEAGRAILPRARRIIDAVADYRLQIGGITEGLEAELSLVVDGLISVVPITAALEEFYQVYPSVHLRILVAWQEELTRMLTDGHADLGLLIEHAPLTRGFERNFCGEIDLAPVAAPHHPLARLEGLIAPELLKEHLQLVLTDNAAPREKRDYGVLATNRWHVSGHQTKHALLRAGVGWGSMPRPIVAADLAEGLLVELRLARWEGADQMPSFKFVVAHRSDKALGPAARWLKARLSVGDRLNDKRPVPRAARRR